MDEEMIQMRLEAEKGTKKKGGRTSSNEDRITPRSPRNQWLVDRWRTGMGLALFSGMLVVACDTNEKGNDIVRATLPIASSNQPVTRGAPRTVTLITGDRVVVGGKNAKTVSVQNAKGRSSVRFIKQRVAVRPGERPHLFVIPEDALPLIAAGRVDRRLFDVTLLIDFEYDDAHRDSLPLIVTKPPVSARSRVVGTQVLNGAVIEEQLPSINGMSATAAKAQVQTVWNAVASGQTAARVRTTSLADAPIEKIWLDGLLRPVLDESVPQIGAPAAWAAGYEGNGVLIAVLDSGVDDTHPDLADRVVASRNFTAGSDLDEFGHGTHVASIIAGSGAASENLYRGVAPGAQLISGKVCEFYDCMESDIIAGMEWAAIEEAAQIINISLGGSDTPGIDPLEEAVNTLTAQYGTLFVIAAGNDGPDDETVSSPGSAEAALTVGAVDQDDEIASSSGRGLTVGDRAIKPDVTAPGVLIIAARAAGTEIGPLVGELYTELSGTSMATPHVAGAAALLLEQHPSWGPAEIKAALMGSATYHPGWTVLDQGAGRVDIENALDTRVIGETPSVSFGLAEWPHHDDEPITRTVVYRNLGPATTLTLTIDVLGPGGIQPPADMFTFMPSAVSLPEGGTASVTMVADTGIDGPDGLYSGRLIASDTAGRILAVPVAVIREKESYDLVLRHLDRAGAPATYWFGSLVGIDRPVWKYPDGGPETRDVTLRVEPGRYAYEAFIEDELFEWTARIVAPNQQIAGDTLLVLDASLASPMGPFPPKPELENLAAEETWRIPTAGFGFSSSYLIFGGGEAAFYRDEIAPPNPELESMRASYWRDSESIPEAMYAAAWNERGKLPDGPIEMDKKETAVVHARYAAPLRSPESPPIASWVGLGAYVDEEFGVGLVGQGVDLPYERMEYYYSPNSTMGWLNELTIWDEEGLQRMTLGRVPVAYRARRHYSTHWNRPPFMTALPKQSVFSRWAYRDGDELFVEPPMYADHQGSAGFITSEGRTALYRDGELIDEIDTGWGGFFEVPSEPAEYRLEISNSQSMCALTTHQEMVWTFASAHVDEGESERLPLLTARFTPELNDQGEARRGPRFHLPVEVARYDLSRPPRVRRPSIEVSYNDGVTWANVRVKHKGHHWEAILNHPRCAEYVSFRATIRDFDGNAVEQTVIRAYALEGKG
jgi:hypothetical protein